ncbi:hypothetical protein [Microcystis phage Mel-JY01]
MDNINKTIKRLTSKFPEAKIKTSSDGKYFVSINGVNIFDEYLIPYADNPETVWTHYDECVKQMDTVSRTHPYRLDRMEDTEKANRIRRRTRKRMNADDMIKKQYEKDFENED